jgi:hypothetical protein
MRKRSRIGGGFEGAWSGELGACSKRGNKKTGHSRVCETSEAN